MNNRLAAMGMLGILATTLAVQACSSDDDVDALLPGPAGSSTGGGGSTHGGSTSGGSTSAGTTTGGTTSAGTTSGGTTSGGTATAGSGGASGSSVGGDIGVGGEAGAGGFAEGGMGGASEAGAGGEGGAVDETVTLSPTTCNYTEVEADSSQDSKLDVTTTLKVICGKVDPGHYNAGQKLVDSDAYAITAANTDLVRFELPTLKDFTRVFVTLDNHDVLITDPITVFDVKTFGGSIILRVSAYGAADIPVAIPYQISIVGDPPDSRCPANANAANFTEAGDGANNRGNDVYVFNDGEASLTAANDSAEATGITVAKASYRVNGTSTDLSRVGDYNDADSYLFHTGATTTQVTLRADWTGGHDLDLFVLKAGGLESSGSALSFSNTSPEYATVRVLPNTDYVAFVGTESSSATFGYSLTFCGGTYAFNGP